MATLLGQIIDKPEIACETLQANRDLLIEPFRGNAARGSVYGDGNIEAKLSRYKDAMDKRILRVSSSQLDQDKAAALQTMRDYVIAELSPEASTSFARFRGGGSAGSQLCLRRRLHAGLDTVLDQAESASAALRRVCALEQSAGSNPHVWSREGRPVPSMCDAVLVGGVTGFLCGVVLIGEPKVMAATGALSFTFSQRWPERVPPRAHVVVDRCID
eukprot:CAMPEP_0119306560 /NCGR_PEP_ID=MMETSP1333-20130426/7283_1 /TAXON_ID=418940 /ORGANISM="Scyphosphaera apsteinii, Strain RCC1455" /LENGTH=215 /DNA_ID=CAMNT_0007309883 /DNA_START=145 /DNA_END=789 /DNA_ORIENTATION=+